MNKGPFNAVLCITAAAALTAGLTACSVGALPRQASPTPDPPSRDLTLDVGVIIHSDGTTEHPDRDVMLDVDVILPATY
ncbi:hypothetical protein [Agromyces indicus]|uniref:Uncharacterized protein n=1 Tax=Agromyces indicus TaxID=758919 RepID=A0ABU1FMQ0_9MICO|nr:hypothetical protein [Agromyces indicus]MDR5693046.1 hypothetical protein [Agromyces indicus]